MKNFELFLPTRYLFGTGVVQKAGAETGKLGRRALLVTGKSSASRSGLLATVENLLKAEGLFVCSLAGVDPNPRLSTCVAGARLCKEHAVDVVVAVGGGSVLDASKTIAALALDSGEPWDFFTGARPITRALPLVDVLTVAATGSEYGPYAVITNEKTGEKLGTFGEAIIPRVSIVDPSLTFTVPARHTAFGAVDIISHHLEAYLACEEAPPIQDELTEAVIRSVIVNTGKALTNPRDLEARSCLLWANTLACGVFMVGRGAMRFDAHAVEHELSAAYDVPHGAGLAVILPALMRWRVEKDPTRVERFARQVF
ncbi:MAG TPA: iron-containing alcohol dehydrogenase, partial [Spirochaetia bacterium]|nr:iron-containing alcohol dehydrogenase [Spirochaetia bacterium]